MSIDLFSPGARRGSNATRYSARAVGASPGRGSVLSAASVMGENSRLKFSSNETTTQPNDIFKVLYEYIKTNQTRSLELFRTFDKSRSGTLLSSELASLVRAIIPNCTPSDVEFFKSMIDLSEPFGSITFADLYKAIKECHTYSSQVRNKDPAAQMAIQKLQEQLKKYNFDAVRAFKKYDASGAGCLDYSDVARMIRDMLPASTTSERRYIIATLQNMLNEKQGGVQQVGISFQDLQTGLEPDWMKRQKMEMTNRTMQIKQEDDKNFKDQMHADRREIVKQRERAEWAQEYRLKAAEEAERLTNEEKQLRKQSHSQRLKQRAAMRMEAAQIAMQVKEEREMHERYRQIEEQEEDEVRKSQAFVASVYASRETKLQSQARIDEEDRQYTEKCRLEKLEDEVLSKYKYRNNQRFVNIVEFADPELEFPSSQSQKLMLKSVSRTTPATEVWAGLSVVDFEKTPPSRYSMLPATKRYEYYKHYGFAGKGAKTSWAHNPTKKPVRLPCHGVWPEQLQDV